MVRDAGSEASQRPLGLEPSPSQSGQRRSGEVAIIGFSGRFPGAVDLDSFWDLLRDGGSGISPVPASRWDNDLYFDPAKGLRGKSYAHHAGFRRRRR